MHVASASQPCAPRQLLIGVQPGANMSGGGIWCITSRKLVTSAAGSDAFAVGMESAIPEPE